VHYAFIVVIIASKSSQVIGEWRLVKISTKWTMWDCPIIWKGKCCVPSFKSITQSYAILQYVFITLSMNIGKCVTWKDVFE
jgi:hypothetical protein